VERILVFEPFLLGDFTMATPAFRLLRRHFPAAQIDCIGPPAMEGLEPFFPWLNRIIPFRCPWSPQYRDYSFRNLKHMWKLAMALRRNRYDWAFDLRGDLRDIIFLYLTGASRRAAFDITGARELLTDVVPFAGQPYAHQVEGNVLVVSHPISVKPEPSEFHCAIEIPPGWREEARRWLEQHEIGEFIAVHPGASLPHKLWPASNWTTLLDTVLLPHLPVILFGTDKESAILDEITRDLRLKSRVHIARVSLPMFFSLTSLARGVISLDSAAAHIAAATGVPVVALLGPSPASLAGPYGPQSRSVYLEDVPCRPCLTHCTQPRNFCILDLPVSMVVSALRETGIVTEPAGLVRGAAWTT
jgi:ADP-heptose:LPS heptosyltransferase